MDDSRKQSAATWLVFTLLVTIGVVGRWGQPEYAVTPIAAVGLLAGYALPRRFAVATPLLAMLITDLVLPSYGSLGLGVTVYAAMAVAPLLGRLLRRSLSSLSAGVARLVALSATPAIVFFVMTNFAVWAFTSSYPPTLAGLAQCYTAALPFFRQMLAGDMTFTAVVFTICWLAGAYSFRGAITQVESAAEQA